MAAVKKRCLGIILWAADSDTSSACGLQPGTAGMAQDEAKQVADGLSFGLGTRLGVQAAKLVAWAEITSSALGIVIWDRSWDIDVFFRTISGCPISGPQWVRTALY